MITITIGNVVPHQIDQNEIILVWTNRKQILRPASRTRHLGKW
jgi:hypothetical protein